MKDLGVSSPAKSVAGPSPCPKPRSPDRFRLTGPSVKLDLRTNAIRRDLADIAMADFVFAPYYAVPIHQSCRAVTAAMRIAPSSDAVAVSELVHGEGFAVVDVSGGWAWGYTLHDGYVSYIAADALGPIEQPTHIVASPAALVFAERSIKAPVTRRLPMGARIKAVDRDDDFLRTADGFVHHRHAVSLDQVEADFVAVAARLIGVSYLWGGRSGNGTDCSGLVQLALAFAGIACPRDSDQQQALGESIAEGEPLHRGDLVFLPGHVGIMADATHLLHANAFWMRVVTEPLADVLARQPEGRGVTARRRLA